MILLINFKTYPSATGKNAIKLAKICKEISRKTKTKIVVAAQIADIHNISKIISTVSQHVDYFDQGRYTGYVLPEAVKANGAIGSLINHSEHKLSLDAVKKTIERCKKLKLKTIVCAASLKEVKKIKEFKPDYIAYEVPELIATGVSISKVKASSVKKFVKLLKGTKIVPLVGAGVSTGNDVKAALKLGCKGVLVASAITKAKDPRKVVLEMCSQA